MPTAIRPAFTLIELLVVVTIIVVLLAQLAPAMDKAIYQAELAVCAARLDAACGSVHSYAFDHRRWYPQRPGTNPTENALHSWRDTSLATIEPFGDFDDRPTLAPYILINKQLQCPLVDAVDLERSIANTYSSYQLWFGFSFFVRKTAQAGMMKLGDPLTWQNNRFGSVGQLYDLEAQDDERTIKTPQISNANALQRYTRLPIPLK